MARLTKFFPYVKVYRTIRPSGMNIPHFAHQIMKKRCTNPGMYAILLTEGRAVPRAACEEVYYE